MLKKIAIITSSIISSYSANATEQTAEEKNAFTGFPYCSGTPQSPSLGSAEHIQNDYQSKFFAIIEEGFDSTPEKNLEECEIMRQEAHSISYTLIPILFPTQDRFKKGVSFTQLSLTEQENRQNFTNTLIIDLKSFNNIQNQCAYLKGITSSANSQDNRASHLNFENTLAENLKKMNEIEIQWSHMRGVISMLNSKISLKQNTGISNSL